MQQAVLRAGCGFNFKGFEAPHAGARKKKICLQVVSPFVGSDRGVKKKKNCGGRTDPKKRRSHLTGKAQKTK